MPACLQVTVILKHMFRPEEFEIEPELKEALDADITSECTKLGKIEKVRQLDWSTEWNQDCMSGCRLSRWAD